MTQPSASDVASRVKGAVGGLFGGGAPAAAANPYQQKAGSLKDALGTIQGMMPDANSAAYQADPEQYAIDFQTWLTMFLDTSDAYQAQQQAAFGYVTLPDGSILPTGDLTPEQRAIFDQANEAKYQNALNSLGLQQANLVADRAQAGFNNQLTRIQTAMNLDDTRLRKAEGQINRQLSGMGESRDRASLIANTKLQAAPYATQGGKSSFSANDLGSLLGEFAAFSGVDPNSSLLSYQGTSMVDPEADMQRFDSLLGVGGALPDLPSLLSEGDGFGIPDVPDLGAIPQLSAPSRVDLSSLLGGAPAAAAGGSAAGKAGDLVSGLLAKLFGGGTGATGAPKAPAFSSPVEAGLTPQGIVNAQGGTWQARAGVKPPPGLSLLAMGGGR